MSKRLTTAYVFLSIFASILATYFFSFSLMHPYIGALVENGNGYTIVETEPDTWSSRNLHVGDTIISVNGLEPSDFEPIRQWGMLEQAKHIRIIEAESGEMKTFTIEQELDTQMVFQIIVPALVFLFTLFATNIIYRSRNESTKGSSLMLILFLYDIAIAYISGGASARGEFLARNLVTLFFVLVPIFYLHFIYSYFKELNAVWFSKKIIWIFYAIVFINTVINALSFTDDLPFGLSVTSVKAVNLGSFMFLFIWAMGLIFLGLKRVTYKAQRYLIKVIVLSNIVAFLPFLFFYVLPYTFFRIQIFSPVILASFILIIPITLVYQFSARKIYDIEFIVGRFRYYAFLSVAPSILGIFLITFQQSDNAVVFTIRGFIIIALTMFFGFYLKEIFDWKFNFKKISEKFNYQDSIFEFTQSIRSANEFDEVVSELREVITENMLVSETYIVEMSKDQKLVKISPNNRNIYDIHVDSILQVSEEVGAVKEEVNGFLLNISETQENYFVLVALEKTNTPKLTRDELSWLKTLAYYTNVTIESFLKIEHFMENLEQIESEGNKSTLLNRVIYQLEEKQRSALAKDLHDSVLQDLVSIKRKIESDEYSNELTIDNDEQRKRILTDMNKVIQMTRETLHELRPNVLYDLGLEKAIKKLVEQNIHTNGFNIRFRANRISEDIPSELQLNLYRITQELLNNTKKHSNAKNISILLVKIKDRITLHYEDDGQGTDPDQIFKDTGSMGMSGIRERVKMLNGTIKVKTAKGEGFVVDVEI